MRRYGAKYSNFLSRGFVFRRILNEKIGAINLVPYFFIYRNLEINVNNLCFSHFYAIILTFGNRTAGGGGYYSKTAFGGDTNGFCMDRGCRACRV